MTASRINLGNEGEICYFNFMDSIIESVYGVGFLLKLLKEKDSLDRTLNPGQCYDGAYKFVDTYPAFPNGNDYFQELLLKSIRQQNNINVDTIKGRVFVELVIDTNGRMERVRIVRGLSNKLESEVLNGLEMINQHFLWEPAYIKREKVKAKIIVAFRFGHDKSKP